MISKKCKKIKLLITDVDGVLTDGGMYYSEKGEILKKFNTKDGMGIEILRNHGIKTVFLTKENSKIARLRGKKVNVDGIYVNIAFKEKELLKICKRLNVTPDEVAYIGDDINDIKIISKVGLSACPNDAVKDVKQRTDYLCKLNGGEGVFREFAELILRYQN
jgi:YrbI family 3-deoxy-D-manno-octulosonate 8-phosphate phosphatase